MNLRPEELCPDTGKRHIPDWASVQMTTTHDCSCIDVNCKDCGTSGCVASVEHTLPENDFDDTLKNIDW